MTANETTSERELLACCPFCGSQNVDAEGWATLPEYAATPEERSGPACDDCGSTAPSIKIWNTRSAGDAPVALTEVETLRADNARLRDASAWRPIETAPRDPAIQIIAVRFVFEGGKTTCIKDPFISFWSPSLNKFFAGPNYWTPLPAAPATSHDHDLRESGGGE